MPTNRVDFPFFSEMPQSLTHMCRVLLRKQLNCHWDYIAELPLPITLKSFLQFENGF